MKRFFTLGKHIMLATVLFAGLSLTTSCGDDDDDDSSVVVPDDPTGGKDDPSQGQDNPSQGQDNPSQGQDNPSQGGSVDVTPVGTVLVDLDYTAKDYTGWFQSAQVGEGESLDPWKSWTEGQGFKVSNPTGAALPNIWDIQYHAISWETADNSWPYDNADAPTNIPTAEGTYNVYVVVDAECEGNMKLCMRDWANDGGTVVPFVKGLQVLTFEDQEVLVDTEKGTGRGFLILQTGDITSSYTIKRIVVAAQ